MGLVLNLQVTHGFFSTKTDRTGSFLGQFLGRSRALICRVPKGRVFKREGYLGKCKDSVWEDWGTLGKIIKPPPLGPPPLTTL